uniref:Beta-defensin-like domain-containing protein n=1 Tax=Buteo japonicus TaxID=224669 RepID=A0A8B9Z5Y0_9AVES
GGKTASLFFCLSVFLLGFSRGLSDSQQCRSNHGHCRRLCFHMERWEGSCSNGRLRCCR